MLCKAYPNGYILQHKNLFPIRPIKESSIFGKLLTSIYFKNDQIKDFFIFAYM